MLRVEVHRSIRKLLGIESVATAVKVEPDAVVFHALAVDAIEYSRPREHFGGGRLDDSRLDGALDVVAASRIDHHRVDAGLLEQVCEEETG